MSTKGKKWDRRFLALAQFVAQWSKDPSTQTGSVIVVPDNRIVSTGYNGFPRKVKDSLKRLKDRDLKYKLIVHAEQNALLFARESVVGCRMYIWPFMPCSRCAGIIIQSGIAEIIAPVSDNPRWKDDFKIAQDILFGEAGIKLRLLDIELD